MPADKKTSPATAWRRAILDYVAGHPDRPLKMRALARELDVPHPDYTDFRAILRQMLAEGLLVLGTGRTLRLPEQTGLVVGVFRAHPRGFGFVERQGGPDLYIHPRRTNTARDGDTVAARLLRPRGPVPGPRGEVTRIIERAPLRWVGILEKQGPAHLVRPQGRGALPPVYVDDPTAKSARVGDMIVVEPLEHTLESHHVRGVIIERLGDPGDARTLVTGVMRRFGLAADFPPDVRQAAREAAADFNPDDVGDRHDLRDLLTITIDPADARDFDDAISIEPLGKGRYRLGVHIADVAHFIPRRGTLDAEARRRGTSTYFPGVVVPMLPERLSNGVCSLQPHEPRFTKSIFITYDRNARVTETQFFNSVIRSDARLTYEQASAILNDEPSDFAAPVGELLACAQDLARRIRKRRIANGMITLSLPEVEIRLDDRGNVADAGPADTSFSHTLIEMFMVEANEAVSRELSHHNLDHLRRIHPEPDPKEVGNLNFLGPVLDQRPPKTLDRDTIRALLDQFRGKPEEMVVNYVLLRGLPQACYSPSREGHFALASEDYAHFTSPIRRYPDLTVHRLLDMVIRNVPPAEQVRRKPSDVELAELGHETSGAERRAIQAEREAKNVLLLRLMRAHIGEVYDAIITGVMSFGVFVQIQPHMAEGLIRVEDFGPDYWEYERRTGVFVGRRTRRLVHLGGRLRVQVANVDELREEMTLVPADGGPIGDVHENPEKLLRRTDDQRKPARGRGRGPDRGRNKARPGGRTRKGRRTKGRRR